MTFQGKPSVYAQGPIRDQTYRGATEWRETLQKMLQPDIVVFSPMRGKQFLQGEKRIDAATYAETLATPAGIVTRDRNDCRTCNLSVLYVPVPEVTIGSCIELGWLDKEQKPIIGCIHPDNLMVKHAMIREIVKFWVPFDTQVNDVVHLTKIAALCRAILLPTPPEGS